MSTYRGIQVIYDLGFLFYILLIGRIQVNRHLVHVQYGCRHQRCFQTLDSPWTIVDPGTGGGTTPTNPGTGNEGGTAPTTPATPGTGGAVTNPSSGGVRQVEPTPMEEQKLMEQ
ncbi:hypothetical protein MKY42_17035 [Paenibacillus sp. FSL W7-1088]|uniref:hypothetical protein n=1 Tax=unclassified Paenibacillus TaxID=185978 RepID=UPI0015C62D3D|nr:hypothetical protein [Paenibacillus sp. E222]QLG40427.1 hypothetical protein HW560_21490 [Paenibacillus sp. E222]